MIFGETALARGAGDPDWWRLNYKVTGFSFVPLGLVPAPRWLTHPDEFGTITVPSYPNPTVRVSVEGGPVIWEDSDGPA